MGVEEQHTPVGEALGRSEAFLAFWEGLSRAARIDRPVLILGERGTGKELAAARLHYLSQRWRQRLVTLNCAALTPSLIESELFGYEAGAFTGAQRRRQGRFETADHGTLFLDEIGNIPVEVQEKILRAVEYGQFERVGGSEPVEVDARIIGATNTDLRTQARKGLFKPDLLDRLSFEVLFAPPLRHRREDIILLANHFAARMAREMGRQDAPRFADQAAAALEAYPWPGNVRELKNVVERAVYRSTSESIEAIDFDPFVSPYSPLSEETAADGLEKDREVDPQPGRSPGGVDKPLKEAVQDLEVRLIREALQKTRYNQSQAARRLGLSYHQFRGLLRKYRPRIEPE